MPAHRFQWPLSTCRRSRAHVQKVDAPTKAILTEFDLGKPGHTLMVPLNEGKNFTDSKLRDVNTFLQFGVVPQLLTTEEATFVRPSLSTAQPLFYCLCTCRLCSSCNGSCAAAHAHACRAPAVGPGA